MHDTFHAASYERAVSRAAILAQYGGAELHTREMVKALRRRGPVGVVRHFSTEASPAEVVFAYADTCTIDDNDVPVHQIGASGWLLQPLRFASKLHAKTRWIRPLYAAMFKSMAKAKLLRIARDYQLLHAVYNGFTPSAQLAADVCRELGIPFVWTPLAHTTLPPGTGWSSAAFRHLYQRADALITMTAYERDWLIQQGACAERVHVCPVSVLLGDTSDPDAFRADYGIEAVPLILFLGRLVDYKGYQHLCEAAPYVWETFPDARFFFLGPLTEEARQWFRDRPDSRFIVPGLVSEHDKTSALAACDVLCVPSTEESLGVTYLEAWSFEKPVVAADIPVLRTIIDHGVDGLLTPQEDKSIADALLRLLSQSELRREMGRRGARKVAAEYDWKHLADRMADIHRTVRRTHSST